MRFFAPALLAIILLSCSSSERVTYLHIPAGNERDTINVGYYETKYGKYDGVYLNYERSIDHAGTSGFGAETWAFHYVYRKKYVILNPDEQSLTTFSLTVNKRGQIGTFYIRVSSPEGPVRDYRLQDLTKEESSDHFMTYKLAFPGIVKGSVVDEGYELSYNAMNIRAPLYHDIELQFEIPCEHLSFQYAYPDWWNVNVKKNSSGILPNFTTVHDSAHHKSILSYTGENIPAITHEPYSPYFKELARSLELMVTKLDMGEIHFTAPTSWQEYASRFRPYLEKGENFLSNRVGNITDDILRGTSSPAEKIDTIVSFLQQQVKEADDPEDRNFTDVLKDKRGNAFEITGLGHAMLRKAGFEPEFLLIHSSMEGSFDSTFYDVYQLDIPAISVISQGKEFLLFPYRKDMAIDQVPEHVQGQMALVVPSKAKAWLKQVTAGEGVEDVVDERFDVSIGEDGGLDVRESRTIRGPFALLLRERLAKVKAEERDRFAKDLLSYYEGEVKMKSFTVTNEKAYKLPLVFGFEYSIDNLVTLAQDEVVFRTAGLFTPSVMKDPWVEATERRNPIAIHFNESYTKSINIRYASEWAVKTELPPVSIENGFGSLHEQFTSGAGELTVRQERRLKRGSQPKEKISELIELVGHNSSAALPTLIFSTKR